MDVQSESCEPPPCDPQPMGKIRKGFKLFGKHKPGKIFSKRSKGEENNKSPVSMCKTIDGLSETVEPEQEAEMEKELLKEQEPEVSQRKEETVDEPLGDNVDPNKSPPRPSISSVTSAKSLGFLSLLRGGRRGGGERRVHTVSQPASRQRRGLKGLFGSMRFKEKEDKGEREEPPPSPLLMSSRANSVEIIKEDLTLTPKSQPRSLDSPEPECSARSPTTSDSSSKSLTEATASLSATANVSSFDPDVPPPLPTTEPPMDPTVDRLSSLLADISSLLTFDSIQAGGDIIADVEAEWGKASRAFGVTEKFSTVSTFKPTPSTTLSTSPVASIPATTTTTTFKPSAASTSSPITSTAKLTDVSSFPITAPRSTLDYATKSTTLTSPLSKPVFTPAPTSNLTIFPPVKPTPSPSPTTKPSTASITATSFSPIPSSVPLKSATPITDKMPPSPIMSTGTQSAPATVTKPPSTIQPLYPSSGQAAPLATPTSTVVSKPSPVVVPLPASTNPAPVVHSPPPAVQATSFKLNSSPLSPSPPSPSPTPVQSLAAAKSPYTPTAVPQLCTDSIQIPTPAPPVVSKMSAAPSPTPASLPNTPLAPTPIPIEAPKTPLVPAFVPAHTALNKTPPAPLPTKDPVQSLPTNALATTSISLYSDKIPTASTPAPVSLSKMPPAPAPAPALTPATVSKPSAAPAPIMTSGPSSVPAPAHAPAATLGKPLTPSQVKGSEGKVSVDGAKGVASPNGLDAQKAWTNSAKREEPPLILQKEPVPVPQGPQPEKRTPPVKAAGLSKIPVSGGVRLGKQPIRDSQPADEEGGRDLPTPGLEEESHNLTLHVGGSEDKISDLHAHVEASLPSTKHNQEESQQLRQPKVTTSIPRDSKIPVKQGLPSPSASQISQAKEPPRTKIPVSKVPVRRTGKPSGVSAPQYVTDQLRK